MTSGSFALSAYTWSKSIDTDSSWGTSVVDPFNLHSEVGLSSFDTRNRFVISYVYDLPVGKGRGALANMNKAGELLLGGWQTNGIFTAGCKTRAGDRAKSSLRCALSSEFRHCAPPLTISPADA